MEQNYKLPKITSAMLVLTHLCNLHCRYCFVNQKPETMTYQTAKDTVHFLLNNCKENEIPSINFFGGEPMLCWNSIIVPLTKYIREELKMPFDLSMTTNGTLLNEERIQFMKDNRIGMLFSIDGDQGTQDYNRPCADGSSSFDKLRDLIPQIAEAFHTTFRMTAIPETCNNVFNNIKFAAENGFQSYFVIPNVYQEWPAEDWEVLCREMHKYAQYFVDCYQNGIGPIRFSEFEKSLKKITQINHAIDNGLFRVGCEGCKRCGLGSNRFASVHPNGDIYACQEMTSNVDHDSPFWIGNIYSGVSDERRQRLTGTLDRNKLHGLNCGACRLNRICDGGCVANNYLVTGDINGMPPVFCQWQQLLLDEAIYVMNSLSDCSTFQQEWREKYGRR